LTTEKKRTLKAGGYIREFSPNTAKAGNSQNSIRENIPIMRGRDIGLLQQHENDLPKYIQSY
jgi:hypothetical protein